MRPIRAHARRRGRAPGVPLAIGKGRILREGTRLHEDGAIGGFGAFVLHHLAQAGALDRGLKIRTMTLPDRFPEHDAPAKQYEEAALSAKHIVAQALLALGVEAKPAAIRPVRA